MLLKDKKSVMARVSRFYLLIVLKGSVKCVEKVMDSLWTVFELLEIMRAVEDARKELERREAEKKSDQESTEPPV